MKTPALAVALLTVAMHPHAQEPDARPLPDLSVMLERAKKASDEAIEIRKNYLCTETVVADELDNSGNKKGTHTDVYSVYFIGRHEVQRHTMHDGKPLAPDAERKEQERIDKLTAKYKANPDETSKNGNVSLKLSSLLRMATVSPARRETYNGRPTLVFDFAGNRNAKAHDLGEEAMKHLTGTIWMDEETAGLTRLTATLRDNFHVGGGLVANIKAGSSVDLTETRIHDEIWFVHEVHSKVDGRFLLFKGFDATANVIFSDYRRMKSTATIVGESHEVNDDGTPVAEPASAQAPPQPKLP